MRNACSPSPTPNIGPIVLVRVVTSPFLLAATDPPKPTRTLTNGRTS